MQLFLGLFLFSFFINSALFVPFINLLYRLKLQRKHQKTLDAFGKLTPIFDRFHKSKAGTPVGGGLLLITTTLALTFVFFVLFHFFWVPIISDFPLKAELKIVFFTFVMFGTIGLFDDIKKIFQTKEDNFFGLRFRHKLFFQAVLSLLVGYWLYSNLQISILNIPFLGVINLGRLFIPFSAFVIIAFANAYNITDGLDGLAGGLLFIALSVFWIISAESLDIPLQIFIAVWLGGLVAFLYFNVYPARIWLGDVGSLSFGATLAVIGLLLGKVMALAVIGGIFVLEVASSLFQMFSRKIFKKRLFKCAPFHLWLQNKGWEEPKIVMRAWFAGIILGVFGLWLATFTP